MHKTSRTHKQHTLPTYRNIAENNNRNHTDNALKTSYNLEITYKQLTEHTEHQPQNVETTQNTTNRGHIKHTQNTQKTNRPSASRTWITYRKPAEAIQSIYRQHIKRTENT